MESDFDAASVEDDTVEGTRAALPGDTSRWQQRDGRVQPSVGIAEASQAAAEPSAPAPSETSSARDPVQLIL